MPDGRPPQQGLRVPPHAQEAEAAVLAAMIISHDAMNKAFQVLRSDCFYDRRNRLIAEGLQALYERNETADFVTLSEELKRQKKLAEAGGLDYLSSLTENVIAPAHVEEHARIVYSKWVQRRLIDIATGIVHEAYDSTLPVDDMLDKAENLIFEIKESKLRGGFVPLKDLLVPAMRAIDRAKLTGRHLTGVNTGFIDLNSRTSGFQRGELVIIAGRPSMGKSSLALNIACNAARPTRENPEPGRVAILSLEMTTEMVVERIICSESRVSLSKIRTGRIKQDELGRIATKMGDIQQMNILVDDSSAISILELKAKVRRAHAEGPLDMVVVDYLQLLDASEGFSGQRNRQQEITEISRALKALAKEINAPVVALSQLSRRPEMREDKKPQLADLRESGAIEQDADLVLLIHRPDFYDTKKVESEEIEDEEGEKHKGSLTNIIIAKQRNGPTGEFELVFIKNLMRFEDAISFRDSREDEDFGEETIEEIPL
ncbi:replicative DNA helicase [bacterium]|nr:replicative DNA helicase [bacterium]